MSHEDVARRAFDAVAALRSATTLEDLNRIGGACFADLGFDYYVGFDALDASGAPKVSPMFGRTLEAWESHFRASGYETDDPILKATAVAELPFFWSEATRGAPLTPIEQRIMDEAREHGLKDGFVAPLRNGDGTITSVLLTGAGVDPTNPDLRTAAHIVSIYFGRMGRLLHRQETQGANGETVLSPRQVECLKWVRAGKSTPDIATLMGLSVHTVNEYIAGACKRLGVRTRVQAVFEAALRGIISL